MVNVDETSTAEVKRGASPPGRTAPAAPAEKALAEVLAGVVRAERVPVDGDFFDDLGADSLVMAQFCARVRKRDDLPAVSMKDIYRHRTVRDLAAALTRTAPVSSTGPPTGPPTDPSTDPSAKASIPAPEPSPLDTVAPARAGTAAYVLCGVAQLLLFLGYV
ncbi:acyl carrier protein, partial [Streptomyces minutiscleroticus]|uniref:acyl carrier protein n=1 Tax=Streptomyces minutiscleroticus TaxID=68238 RepID=UPI003D9EDBC5